MTIEGDRVAGFGKLEDGLRQASPWYTWGPYVSERQWGTVRGDYSQGGVGGGPGGLRPGRRRVELPPVRSRQVSCLPLGRGRTRRVQRRPPEPVHWPGAVERAGRVPQRAAVRADRAAGQPRRGRQGAQTCA